MAAVSSYIAAAAVVVAAGSAYSAHQDAQNAADDQKKANELSTNEQKAQQAAQRRQQIREERIKRASIIQSSQNSGVSESSGDLGAQSVLNTQTGISISNLGRSSASADAISALQQSAVNNNMKAQTAQAIGGVASSVFGAASPYAAKSLFGSETKAADVGKTNSSKGLFGG